MTDWMVYSKIHAMKNLKFKKTKVAAQLGINYRTVKKFWDMEPQAYEEFRVSSGTRSKLPDAYRTEIISWLKEYPDMTTSQIYDWLVERYGIGIDFAERTLRDYVLNLRVKECIPRRAVQRQYEAVEDPPMGFQGQVDLGEIWLKDSQNRRIKLYCFAMVLSHSRHKYVFWQLNPFTTETFIMAHQKAFAFYGGRPTEIVYDQDRVMVVSENSGDIIHTEGFQTYISVSKFRVYLCRGYDPESKGRIEAVVKYVKNNFAKHREFTDIESFNDDCLDWLERRGNGKKHEITQRIPAEVFAIERDHLTPVSHYEANASERSVTYQVRKDNTVLYASNRYQVPKGTYRLGLRVVLHIKGGFMVIVDAETGALYARHTISHERGKLVKDSHAGRELNKTLTDMYESLHAYFENTPRLKLFLEEVKNDKPRYIRDQLGVIISTCQHPDLSKHKESALEYCLKYGLFSASEFKAATEYFHELSKSTNLAPSKPLLSKPYPLVAPSKREVSEYSKLMEVQV